MLTRGLRNWNPGNIEKGDSWRGLAKTQTDPRFCTFIDYSYGWRAMALILLGYERKHNLRTVQEIIHRWAPPVENDTGAYVSHVASQMGVSANAPLDLSNQSTLASLMGAIGTHENGSLPAEATEAIAKGITLAEHLT